MMLIDILILEYIIFSKLFKYQINTNRDLTIYLKELKCPLDLIQNMLYLSGRPYRIRYTDRTAL